MKSMGDHMKYLILRKQSFISRKLHFSLSLNVFWYIDAIISKLYNHLLLMISDHMKMLFKHINLSLKSFLFFVFLLFGCCGVMHSRRLDRRRRHSMPN